MKKNYLTSISIVIAGILIAGAVMYSNNSASRAPSTANTTSQEVAQETSSTDNVRPIDENDHIRGNPNAKVKIVEYSDFECPFCKRFHGTMNQMMDEYGEDGQVAWVYRHFPLDSLHPKNARKVAIASECANELGGNDAFWTFTDGYFELTPANDRTDLSIVLPQLVARTGINEQDFNKCIASGKYDKHVQDDVDNAITTGGGGTPWSIVIMASGETLPINGAQPYEAIRQVIDFALEN